MYMYIYQQRQTTIDNNIKITFLRSNSSSLLELEGTVITFAGGFCCEIDNISMDIHITPTLTRLTSISLKPLPALLANTYTPLSPSLPSIAAIYMTLLFLQVYLQFR